MLVINLLTPKNLIRYARALTRDHLPVFQFFLLFTLDILSLKIILCFIFTVP